MRWPWSGGNARERSNQPPAPPPATSPAGWLFAPPLRRVVGDPPSTTAPLAFPDELAAWRDPSFTAQMTHLVSPYAPSGIVDGDGLGTPVAIAAPVELPLPAQAPARVQRAARGARTAAMTTATPQHLPVLHPPVVSAEPAPAGPTELASLTVPADPILPADPTVPADPAVPADPTAPADPIPPVLPGPEAPTAAVPVPHTLRGDPPTAHRAPVAGGATEVPIPKMPLQRVTAPAAGAPAAPPGPPAQGPDGRERAASSARSGHRAGGSRLGLGAPLPSVPASLTTPPASRGAVSLQRAIDQSGPPIRPIDPGRSDAATAPTDSAAAEAPEAGGSPVRLVGPAPMSMPLPLPESVPGNVPATNAGEAGEQPMTTGLLGGDAALEVRVQRQASTSTPPASAQPTLPVVRRAPSGPAPQTDSPLESECGSTSAGAEPAGAPIAGPDGRERPLLHAAPLQTMPAGAGPAGHLPVAHGPTTRTPPAHVHATYAPTTHVPAAHPLGGHPPVNSAVTGPISRTAVAPAAPALRPDHATSPSPQRSASLSACIDASPARTSPADRGDRPTASLASGPLLSLLPTTIRHPSIAGAVSVQRHSGHASSQTVEGFDSPPGAAIGAVPALQLVRERPAPTADPVTPLPVQRLGPPTPARSAVRSSEPAASGAPATSGSTPPPSVQRNPDATSTPTPTEPEPAPAPGGAAAGTPHAAATHATQPTAMTADQLDDLARRLMGPIARRIKAEIVLDRERRGMRTDAW